MTRIDQVIPIIELAPFLHGGEHEKRDVARQVDRRRMRGWMRTPLTLWQVDLFFVSSGVGISIA